MLYLLRHGQSIVNIERRIKCRRLDGDLTTLGYNQAHKAGLWLKEKRIRYIVTSPVMRAQQTAEIIGKVLNLRPQVDDRLREMDCGDLEDRTDDGAWDIWHRIYNNWLNGIPDAQFPNGESYREAYDRFMKSLVDAQALVQERSDQGVLLVTHGGLIRAIVPYLCVNAAALQRVATPGNAGLIILEPYDRSRFICRAWNIIEHLQ